MWPWGCGARSQHQLEREHQDREREEREEEERHQFTTEDRIANKPTSTAHSRGATSFAKGAFTTSNAIMRQSATGTGSKAKSSGTKAPDISKQLKKTKGGEPH
jgi:hypothetical protein